MTNVRGRATGGDAQPRIVDRRRQLLGQPVVLQPQVDEARPGDFRRLAEVGHVEPADDLGGHLARRPAQPLAQRHGEVGLVIAELRVLAAADHLQQFFRSSANSPRHGGNVLQVGENAHAQGKRKVDEANRCGIRKSEQRISRLIALPLIFRLDPRPSS